MKNQNLRCLCEGGVCVALALGLSYLKIKVSALGGSVDFVMVPLIFYAVRWGLSWGMGAGLVFGTLKFFLAGGTAVNWESMLLDYSLAYMFVGFAGVLHKTYSAKRIWALPLGALIGCFCRFIIHFISGITIYAEYLPDEFMGISNISLVLYSVLYNGVYMLPNTVIAIILCALLAKPLERLPGAKAA